MSEFYGPTSHRYFSQRLRLHYVDWGNSGAPPLLLVHGGRDHCRADEREAGNEHEVESDVEQCRGRNGTGAEYLATLRSEQIEEGVGHV